MATISIKKAPNYGYLRNCKLLHNLIEDLLHVEETIFIEILKIIAKCKTQKEYEEFYIRFLAEHPDQLYNKCLSQLWNIYQSDYEIGGLRGRFLELLMFYLLKREYNYVDMRCFLSNGTDTSPKEIDVFGWDEEKKRGEFYECKVNYKDVKKKDWVEYLKNLVEVNKIFNYNNKYGFVTLADDRAFFLYKGLS